MVELKKDAWHYRLGNEEFAKLYTEICDSISEVSTDVENPIFIKYFDEARKELKFINMIVVKEKGHELTNTLNTLHQDRVECIRTILNLVDTGVKVSASDMREAATILKGYFKKYGKSWLSGTQDKVSQRLKQIFGEVRKDDEITLALETSGIDYFYKMLQAINDEYEDIRLERTVAWSGRDMSNIDTGVLRKKTWQSMRALIRSMEDMQRWNEAEELSHAIAAIRKVISRSQTIILRRLTMKAMENAEDKLGDVTPEMIIHRDLTNKVVKLPNWIKETLDIEKEDATFVDSSNNDASFDDEVMNEITEDVLSTDNNPLAGDMSEEETNESLSA